MIRFDYVKTSPWIRDQRITTGVDKFDDWWMTNSVLGSTWVEYGNDILCAVRGEGSGTTYGVSILRAEKSSDLADSNSWEILHKDAPAFQATDMPTPYGNYPAPTTGIELFIDTDVTTNGFDRLWITFKAKEINLDRADYPQWDAAFTGTAIGGTYDIGYTIAWREQVSVFNGSTELVQGIDYQLNNEGSGSTNGEIEFLTDQNGNSLTFKYVQQSFRYAFYSDDGGVAWTYYGPFLGSGGRPYEYGQPSLFRHNDGSHTWHMVTTQTPTNPAEAFIYARSTGPSGGNWTWVDETAIADFGDDGDWNAYCAVGTGVRVFDGYAYLLGTCGAGADIDWGTNPESLPDATSPANIITHTDYPTAHGLWRCPLTNMTTPSFWEEYAHNPVSYRPGGTASAMWNGDMIGGQNDLRITYEGVGTLRDPVSGPQSEATLDFQYNGDFSVLSLPAQPDYITGNLTIQVNFVSKALGFPIIQKGPNGLANLSTVSGQFYVHVTDEGGIVVH